jgi:predicted kinase
MVTALGFRSVSFDEINAERSLPFGASGVEHDWAATLEVGLERLGAFVSAGDSVVVDDTFCHRWLRDRVCGVARQLGAIPLIVHLAVEPEILRRRYDSLRASAERPVLSPSAFDEHLRTFEAPSSDEPVIRFSSLEAASGWVHNLAPETSS